VFKIVARTQPITAKASNAFATRKQKSTILEARLAVVPAANPGMESSAHALMVRSGTVSSACRTAAKTPPTTASRRSACARNKAKSLIPNL
jgi:hypothetical protein